MSKSNKRRRCINVDGGYVDLLKGQAEKLEKISHTKLATLILTGDHAPVGAPRSRKKGQGVSMTEALWLAVKLRDHSSDESTVGVAERILEGTMPPLTSEEIQHGIDRAAKREAKRAESVPEEKTAPKSSEKDGKINGQNIGQESTVMAQREHEKEEREKQRMKLHKGQVYEQERSRSPDKLEPGEEFYSGVKYF
jgi:hypothetical protein